MSTLTISPKGGTRVHTIDVPTDHSVRLGAEDAGLADVVAIGANVVISVGHPEVDAHDYIVVHDGVHRVVDIATPAYARAFVDRPVDDY